MSSQGIKLYRQNFNPADTYLHSLFTLGPYTARTPAAVCLGSVASCSTPPACSTPCSSGPAAGRGVAPSPDCLGCQTGLCTCDCALLLTCHHSHHPVFAVHTLKHHGVSGEVTTSTAPSPLAVPASAALISSFIAASQRVMVTAAAQPRPPCSSSASGDPSAVAVPPRRPLRLSSSMWRTPCPARYLQQCESAQMRH